MKIKISESDIREATRKINEVTPMRMHRLPEEGNDYYEWVNSQYHIRNTDKTKGEVISAAKLAVDKFLSKVPIWDAVIVEFVSKTGGKLGRFIAGSATSQKPIIILSEKNILSTCKQYNLPVNLGVETTIYHELAHALVEIDVEMGYGILSFEDEEEFAEEFARELYEWGEVDDKILDLIKRFKEEA